ncbi:MAG: class I SAM-dependent methyltransferase, partial [Myxococcota bacterium]
MQTALAHYLDARARGADHRAGVRAAAEAVAADPWRVVTEAGALARARPGLAEDDLGLTGELRRVAPGDPRAIARVEAGQPHPQLDVAGRRKQGAFDTPVDLAREVARATVTAARRARRGLDPACGAGAFLVAMAEAGVRDLVGTDLDPVVVEVARVACPSARVTVADALAPGELADVVCGNPP